MGRIIIFNCDSTIFASFADSHTIVNAPQRSPSNDYSILRIFIYVTPIIFMLWYTISVL